MLELAITRLAGSSESPMLLVVGPSLGTSVVALWDEAAFLLGDRFEVVGWDLPGHGRSAPATGFSIADLADAVRDAASRLAGGRPTGYAGVSVGGLVGFALACDPGPFGSVTTIASAPCIGEPWAWQERAELVARAGTAVMVSGSAVRWFAPGFPDRNPSRTGQLLDSLVDADDVSYAATCRALSSTDLWTQLDEVRVPLLVASGEYDDVVTPTEAHRAAEAVAGAERVFTGCGHLPPAEDPDAVASALGDFITRQEMAR